jgi:hypothetical protein
MSDEPKDDDRFDKINKAFQKIIEAQKKMNEIQGNDNRNKPFFEQISSIGVVTDGKDGIAGVFFYDTNGSLEVAIYPSTNGPIIQLDQSVVIWKAIVESFNFKPFGTMAFKAEAYRADLLSEVFLRFSPSSYGASVDVMNELVRHRYTADECIGGHGELWKRVVDCHDLRKFGQ